MPIPIHKKDSILCNNPTVTHLEVSDRGLLNDDLRELAELLLKNKHIISLYLHRNNLTGEGMLYLSSCQHLQEIDLSQNNINDQGVEYLLQIPSLRRLDLRRNNVKNEGAKIILNTRGSGICILVCGNRNIDKALLIDIQKMNEETLDDRENPQSVILANNPSSQWTKCSQNSSKANGLSSDVDLKESGHKNNPPTK